MFVFSVIYLFTVKDYKKFMNTFDLCLIGFPNGDPVLSKSEYGSWKSR